MISFFFLSIDFFPPKSRGCRCLVGTNSTTSVCYEKIQFPSLLMNLRHSFLGPILMYSFKCTEISAAHIQHRTLANLLGLYRTGSCKQPEFVIKIWQAYNLMKIWFLDEGSQHRIRLADFERFKWKRS
jgi:hypothetical protein